jgi:hypothetical protein
MARITFTITLAALLPLAGCQQQKKNPPPRHGTMEEQLKCASMAEEQVMGGGELKRSHYSPSTGVCAGWYKVSLDGINNNIVYNSEIHNVIEQQEEIGRYREQGGVMDTCLVKMPNGEKKECHSEDEFNKFAEVYFSDK